MRLILASILFLISAGAAAAAEAPQHQPYPYQTEAVQQVSTNALPQAYVPASPYYYPPPAHIALVPQPQQPVEEAPRPKPVMMQLLDF